MKKLTLMAAALLVLSGCVAVPVYDSGYSYYGPYYPYPYAYSGPEISVFVPLYNRHGHHGGYRYYGGHGGGHGRR